MPTDKHIFFLSKKKLGLLILANLAFIGVFGYFSTINPTNENTVRTKILSIILLVIFVILLPNGIRGLFRKAPALILDKDGIVANSVLIRWYEVEKIEIGRSLRGNFITINRGYSKSQLILMANLFDIRFDELAPLVQQYYKEYGRASQSEEFEVN